MSFNLRNRNFLKLLDFTQEEIKYLLDLSFYLKRAKIAGCEQQRLKGKKIALIFEKASTRTRCAFESAAFDQGACVTYLGPEGSHMGKKESIKDTARVLGRMFDGIEYRGFGQNIVETLAKYSNVPVWNGLTDEFHPTQVLADFMTMIEHNEKPLHKMSLCFLGDTRNNVSNSLMVGSAKMGIDFRAAGPKDRHPDEKLLKQCRELAGENGAKISVTEDPEEAVKGADFLYTDVWLSMGESEDLWRDRIKKMLPYQVNKTLVEKTGNKNVRFLHCLPSFHNRETSLGEKIFKEYNLDGLEVTEEVFESAASVVFDEAENRMHTIKAVMVASLGD
ncbi:ornithine carbamoyltransferase [candidate division WOR-3 bacterium]|nr:ornithine carbamoyltransferase [candidate division WOR-3 bacterium]